jgi:peroxiredoxin
VLEKIEAGHGKLVAISTGTQPEATELAERLGLTYPVLADTDLSITKAFGALEAGKAHPRPATFVLDGDRRVVFRHAGANAADRPPIDDILSAL